VQRPVLALPPGTKSAPHRVCDVENYGAVLRHIFAVDPETGANQRSSGVSAWYLWNHCQTLMMTRVCEIQLQTFRPEDWDRVHTEIITSLNNTCVSKSQRKTRPILQNISIGPLVIQRSEVVRIEKVCLVLAIRSAQILYGSVPWDQAAHWML
jgi:hypothetical protein